jgi:Domain of unknown function (DUF2383)
LRDRHHQTTEITKKVKPIMTHKVHIDREAANKTLNSLMRGELAAAETYRHAITALASDVPLEINLCLTSHDLRAVQLAEHITLAGGTPVSGSGLWGAFARLVESGAALLGRSRIIAALVEGENQGLLDYRTALEHLDAGAVTLIRSDLLPEQVRTHGLMNMLARRHAL